MRNFTKRAGAALAAAIMAASLVMNVGTPVGAEEVTDNGSVTTSISGGTTTFIKHLVMDSDANIPNATFSYKIEAAGTADLLTSSQNLTGFEVVAGLNPQSVTMSCKSGSGSTEIMSKSTTDAGTSSATYTLPYTASDKAVTKISGTTEGSSASPAPTPTEGDSTGHGTLAEGKKCVFKVVTLDFSQCGFTEAGVYRYKLTESGGIQNEITNDGDSSRFIDVYVENDDTDGLKVTSCVMHKTVNPTPTPVMDVNGNVTGKTLGDKSDGYVNNYDTSNLTFGKTVAGNQGSKDKYFKFTVTISNAEPGTIYTVDNSTHAESTPTASASTNSEYTSMSNPDSITVPAAKSGQTKSTVSQVFYLKDGQSITIKGLAKGTTWTITEDNEGYDSKADSMEPASEVTSASQANTDGVNEIGATVATSDQTAYYKNTKNGIIPTGVIMTIAPFAAAVIIGGTGVVVILVKRKKEQEG